MATLHSISMPEEPRHHDEPQIYLARLALGPSDLLNFHGLWSMADSDRVLRGAVDRSKQKFNYSRVIKYHFTYHEWIGPSEMIIREADLEVYVV
jgi:hypothetical protein